MWCPRSRVQPYRLGNDLICPTSLAVAKGWFQSCVMRLFIDQSCCSWNPEQLQKRVTQEEEDKQSEAEPEKGVMELVRSGSRDFLQNQKEGLE